MKCSRKIKLLSSLSTAVVVTSLITTSCAVVTRNNNDNAQTNSIDIANISWVQRSKYTASNSTEIINIIFNDNTNNFAHYPGLESAITITAPITSGNVAVTISVTSGDTYTGNTACNATWIAPQPDLIDINTLAWKMRGFYSSTDSATIVNAVQLDNGSTSGAQISSWDNINITAAVSGCNISINVIVGSTNTKYTGSVRWSAVVEIFSDFSNSINSGTGFRNSSTKLYAVKQGRQATIHFYGKKSSTTSSSVIDLITLPSIWDPNIDAACALMNYSSDVQVGMAWINGDVHVKIHPQSELGANTELDFTLTYTTVS